MGILMKIPSVNEGVFVYLFFYKNRGKARWIITLFQQENTGLIILNR